MSAVAPLIPKITSERVLVTPEIAEEWLKANKKNRPMYQSTVDRYAQAMVRGEWTLSNDAITFDWDGDLANGQHRLQAVVKTGLAQEFLVLTGVDPEMIDIADSGRKRSLADHLAMRGEKNVLILAGGLMALWEFRRLWAELPVNPGPSIPQMLALYYSLGEIRPSVAVAGAAAGRPGLAPSTGFACHYEFSRLPAPDSERDANAFFSQLVKGEGLNSTHPILALRRQLEENRTSHRKLPRTHQAALTIKAWNAWREGRELRLLIWRAGGSRPQPFPQPR